MIDVLIHAVPQRLWFVDGFLIPELRRQGNVNVSVWCDTARRGNLAACRMAFETCSGTWDTWHLQDDVLPASDFVARAEALESEQGVIAGFASEVYGPDADLRGRVYPADLWYSFQCIRIPNHYARAFARWLYVPGELSAELAMLLQKGFGDDSLFREFLEVKHPAQEVLNLAPNMVDHVDHLLGGSIVSPFRGYSVRAAYWNDRDADERLREWMSKNKQARCQSP